MASGILVVSQRQARHDNAVCCFPEGHHTHTHTHTHTEEGQTVVFPYKAVLIQTWHSLTACQTPTSFSHCLPLIKCIPLDRYVVSVFEVVLTAHTCISLFPAYPRLLACLRVALHKDGVCCRQVESPNAGLSLA